MLAFEWVEDALKEQPLFRGGGAGKLGVVSRIGEDEKIACFELI